MDHLVLTHSRVRIKPKVITSLFESIM